MEMSLEEAYDWLKMEKRSDNLIQKEEGFNLIEQTILKLSEEIENRCKYCGKEDKDVYQIKSFIRIYEAILKLRLKKLHNAIETTWRNKK